MLFIAAVLLVIGISGGSVYVFPSGMPQPADFLLLLFALICIMHSAVNRQKIPTNLLPISWSLLVFWVAIVAISWAIVYNSSLFLFPILFWVFNILVSGGVVYYCMYRERGSDDLYLAVCIGLIVSGIGVLISIGLSSRPTGFFNNPNQLAYYSMLAMSAMFVLKKMTLPMSPLPILAFLCGILGVLSAASFAAMAGLVFIFMGFLFENVSFKVFSRVLIVCAVVVAAITFSDISFISEIYDNLIRRFERLDSKIEGMYEQRNYDRMLAFPEYMILGAGEGHLERFYPHDRQEIHSSFGLLLFAYGVPAITLFLLLTYTALRRAPVGVWLLFAAPVAYSFTHMGLRTTYFWLLIALIWLQYGLARNSIPSRQ